MGPKKLFPRVLDAFSWWRKAVADAVKSATRPRKLVERVRGQLGQLAQRVFSKAWSFLTECSFAAPPTRAFHRRPRLACRTPAIQSSR